MCQLIRYHRPVQNSGVDATGHPTVYGLHNTKAAQGTRTQALHGLNATGLSLNGGTRFVPGKLGLWDGGTVLTNHREFGGRVRMLNPAPLSSHATHLAGTLVAQVVAPGGKPLVVTLCWTDGANDSAFVAYPNPVVSTLLVRYLQPGATSVMAEVYSVAGHLEKTGRFKKTTNNLFTLDLPVADLPVGVYVLRVSDGRRVRSLRFLRR